MNPHFGYQEFEQLFAHTIGRGARSVALTASRPGAGVTMLTKFLAQRIEASGRSVLLVDLNLRSPSLIGVNDTLRVCWQPEDRIERLPLVVSNDRPGMAYLPAPKESESLLLFRDPARLRQGIAAWQQHYDCVLFDTSPMQSTCFRNVTPESVCAAVDATILVVLAGMDSEQSVRDGATRLRERGAAIAGCVINDFHNPRLGDEICRETRRFDPILPGLMARTRRSIRNSGFLNAAI